MVKNKSPGIDGTPTEFYQKFGYVTEWLYEIIIELGEKKFLTETMRAPVIKLSFKKGDG